jgi:hypothetical protein
MEKTCLQTNTGTTTSRLESANLAPSWQPYQARRPSNRIRTIARAPDEVEAQAQQVMKEVRFDLQDLAKLDINGDEVPKTRMRRKSLEAPVFRKHEDDRRTSTLHEGEEEAPQRPLKGACDDFKEYNDQEVFDDSRYRFEAGHYDDEDPNARLESLAEMYGRKGKSTDPLSPR